MVKKGSKKVQDIQQALALVAVLVLFNYVGHFVFTRFDLTAEKRYSLSDASIEQIKKLDDTFFVRVYLEGKLPAHYKRLRDATQEMLDEYRAYSAFVEYEFIDPSAADDEKERVAVYQKLAEEGLKYNNIRYNDGDAVAEKIIFPGAIIAYKGKEIPVQLFKGQMGVPEEYAINNAVQQLEYEFSSSIRKLTTLLKPTVGIMQGYGSLSKLALADFTNGLTEFYDVKPVEINGQLNALAGFKALVVAKPQQAITDKDKFIIDQFIMKGGRVLWLVEHIFATMDSLQTQSTTMGIPNMINLEDQLFKYGARINTDILLDLQALPIPIVTGFVGDKPRQEFFPWYYFPLITPTANHPIVKNLDAIKTEFVSSIDTISSAKVNKTILLTTSKYTKVTMTPTRISLNTLREQPDERQFNKPNKAIAVLLEGEFASNFTNRIPKNIAEDPSINFKTTSIPTKQIIIADGDIAANRFNASTKEYYALGYDRYTNRIYANKDFLMNCINYLCDDSGLIAARSKEFKIRLFDPTKLKAEKAYWQMLNTLLPITLGLLLSLAVFTLRRRLYSR